MSTLSADERELFDRGYRQWERRALRLARKRCPEDADEILNAAMLHVIETVTRQTDPRPMPVSQSAFGREFVRTVGRIARVAVRGNDRYTTPVHAYWGETPPPVSRHKLAERLLCHDFEDISEYEGAAAADDYDGDAPVPLPKHRGPCWPKMDRDRMQAELEQILARVIGQLSVMQRDVVALQLAGVTRNACALGLGISVKTFDIHWSRAKQRLRVLLMQEAWAFPDPGFADNREWPSDWSSIFLEKQIRQARRSARLVERGNGAWLAELRASTLRPDTERATTADEVSLAIARAA